MKQKLQIVFSEDACSRVKPLLDTDMPWVLKHPDRMGRTVMFFGEGIFFPRYSCKTHCALRIAISLLTITIADQTNHIFSYIIAMCAGAKWNPSKVPLADVQLSHIMVLEELMNMEKNQKNGLVFMIDRAGIRFAHYRALFRTAFTLVPLICVSLIYRVWKLTEKNWGH